MVDVLMILAILCFVVATIYGSDRHTIAWQPLGLALLTAALYFGRVV